MTYAMLYSSKILLEIFSNLPILAYGAGIWVMGPSIGFYLLADNSGTRWENGIRTDAN